MIETALAGALLLVLGGAVFGKSGYGAALQGFGCVVAFLRLGRTPRAVSRAVERLDPVVVALLLLLVASAMWSADPALTARRVAGVIAASVFGLYLADRYSLTEQLMLVMRALTVAAVLSAVVAVLAPRYGVADGAWRGVFLTKNVLARLMTLGVVASLLAMVSLKGPGRGRVVAAACGLVCGGVLLQAGSAFASLVLALVVAVRLVTFVVSRTRYPIREGTIVGVTTAAAAGAAWVWLHWSEVLEALGKSSGLTGRLPLWDSVMPEIGDRFWFGYGYGAFWRGWEEPSALVWLRNPWGPPHAHNGVLEMALNVGAVGAALWLCALLVCLRQAVMMSRRTSAAYWPAALVLLILVFNVTEVTLMNNAFFWSLFVAASTSVSARTVRGVRQPVVPTAQVPNGATRG